MTAPVGAAARAGKARRFPHPSNAGCRTVPASFGKEGLNMKALMLVAMLMLAFPSIGMARDLDRDRGLIRTDSDTANEDLARDLANPISTLISLPLQFNYNGGLAVGDGKQYGFTASPVVQFQLNEDWNLISRTVVPIIGLDGVAPGGGSQFGFGPAAQSLFFSPRSEGDFTWGGRACRLASDRDGRSRAELLGDRPDGRRTGAKGAVDRRRDGQPHLVGLGKQRVQHVPAAVPRLHDGERRDGRAQHGVDLRLEEQPVDGSDQRVGQQAGHDRRLRPVAQRRRQVLGRLSGRGPHGRWSLPRPDVPVHQLTRRAMSGLPATQGAHRSRDHPKASRTSHDRDHDSQASA